MGFIREPWVIAVIVLVVVLVFMGPKLPSIARSLGQSFRIIRSEVKESKNDAGPEQNDDPTKTQSSSATAPVEGTVVSHQQKDAESTGNTGNNTP